MQLLKEKRQAIISHAVTKGLNPHAPMKPSGIEWLGDVPEHWEVKALRMIASVVRGASPRPAGDPRYFGGGDVPWVATRADDSGITFVAFTATPKNKTMELFGTRPEAPKRQPITEAGSGSVQEKERTLLAEIIEKVNDLFDGELTDQDKLVYVNDVIKGKLLESETLRQQAVNNTKEQFANSPDLKTELLNAIMSALDAHSLMSTQALSSDAVQRGIKDILLNNARLYETLRDQASR